MSITNIERMVDALVRDEMNMVRSMGMDELDNYVECLIRDRRSEEHTSELQSH